MKYLFVLLIVAGLALCAHGQRICDVDGDGSMNGADITRLSAHYQNPDFGSLCGLDCNIDGDADSLTIADFASFLYLIDSIDPPVFARNPDDDTLRLESVQAEPGELLYISLYLKTVDTLVAFDALVTVDVNYLTIESFIPDSNNPEFHFPRSNSRLNAYYPGFDDLGSLNILLPGLYHLGEIEVAVNPDIAEPVTTYITFGTCPDDNFHTGFSNITYFVPVLVEGEITITPTGIQDNPANLPNATSIKAYPNPFNSSVNIVVQSPEQTELAISDVLGREVCKFSIDEGVNNIIWEGIDLAKKPVNSGVYFARLRGTAPITQKLILVK